MEYTITLSEVQDKALSHIAYDPQDWIENAVFNQCRLAIDEIVEMEVDRIDEENGELFGTKEDIVMAANIKSAAERELENV